MARGQPDWGITAVQELIPKSQDINELAVRLGSLDCWTRTGTVFLLDNFNSGIFKWNTVVTPPSYIITSRKSAFISPYVAKFYMNSPIDEYIYMYRMLPVFLDTPIGIEAFLAMDGQKLYIKLTFFVYYNGIETDFTVKINIDTKEISIFDNVLGEVFIATGIAFHSSVGMYNTFKLVIDQKTGLYKYLKLNNTIYDLSEYTGEQSITGYPDHVNFYIEGHNSVGYIQELYCGGVIITQNE